MRIFRLANRVLATIIVLNATLENSRVLFMTKAVIIFRVVLRGLLVTIVAAVVLCFFVGLFFPKVSDPHSPDELKLSNLVGIAIWVASAAFGILAGVRFWKNPKKEPDENLLSNDLV